MAFWDREKEPVTPEPAPWKEAKQISPDLAAQPEILAPGWYFYKEDYMWHGLKPGTGKDWFQKGFDFQTLRDLQKWLGVPVPQDLLLKDETKETLSQQIENLRRSPSRPVSPPPAVEYNRKRNIDIHFRATPQECDMLKERVEQSGMTQTNYLLRCALQNPTVFPEAKPSGDLQALFQEVHALLAEVGRQGGMLKMVIKPNEGQRTLHPEEWDALIQTVQDQTRIKKNIEKTLERINGYFEAYDL